MNKQRDNRPQDNRRAKKVAPITFASIVGKKEVISTKDVDTHTEPVFDMKQERYIPPSLFHHPSEFSTWVLYNFNKIRDIHNIIIESNMDFEYYSSFNFLDKLAHFIYNKSDKTLSSYDEINESDELFEYIIKRDTITYKE